MVMMKEKIVFTSSFSFFSYNKPENEPGTRKKNVNEARDVERKKINNVKKKEYSETGFFPRMIPIELDPAEAGGGGSGAREWAIPYRWLTNKKDSREIRGCVFGAVLCFIDFRVETNFRALSREI